MNITNKCDDVKYRIEINIKIKKVIFNPPATIVLWNNDDKTIVKCAEGDRYDRRTGVLLCIAKYLFGNTGKYNRELEKLCPEESLTDVNNHNDDYNIFHDQDIISKLKLVISRLTDENLIKSYAELNCWKLPEYFAESISLPTYVYYNFQSLPIKVRNKSITPILQLVKDEFARRQYENYLAQLSPVEHDAINKVYTWEKYQKDERKNLE